MAIDGNSPRKQKQPESELDKSENSVEIDEDSSDERRVETEGTSVDLKGLYGATSSTNRTKNTDLPLKLNQQVLEQSEDSMQAFLRQLVGSSNSKVYDVLNEHGRVVICDDHEVILVKGARNTDVYTILKGTVQVVTSGNQVIRKLRTGETFGELSVIFDIPISATIRAGKHTVLVAVNSLGISKLLGKVKFDLINWCIRRHYLPTCEQMESGRMYRRLAFETLKTVPLFHDWSENVLKQLILSFNESLVTLYPRKSYLVLEGDPLTSLLVVVFGKLEVFTGSNGYNKTVHVTSHINPFVFTEVGVLAKRNLSSVSMRAAQCCHVIQINKGWLMRFVESYPNIESLMCEKSRVLHVAFKRMSRLLKRHDTRLHLELLTYDLKQLSKYRHLPAWELIEKLTDGDLQEITVGCDVLETMENKNVDAVVIVLGQATLTDETPDNEPELTTVRNPMETSGDVPASSQIDVEESRRQVFNAGDVIDISAMSTRSIVAVTLCLVLKIRTIHDSKPSSNSTHSLEYV